MDAESCVRLLNDAWQRGDWDAVRGCLHPDVIMLLPDGDEILRGHEAMVDSYREFFDTATLHGLTIEELTVFDFGATAVCHMRFLIEYAIDGEREEAEGLEVYTLAADEDGRARIVWRTQQLFGDVPLVTLEE